MLERHFSAERINEIINHPEVRPWIASGEAYIDLKNQVANKNNFLLVGEFGATFFINLQSGVYELHTQVLPKGRGLGTLDLVKKAFHWMFTRTDCYEILTRVPENNRAAKALAIKSGIGYEFTRTHGYRLNDRLMSVDIFGMRIQDWVLKAKGLVEIGERFHARLHEEGARLGIKMIYHEDDPNHNRYVGAICEMVLNGQIIKAMLFYNRWALISRHDPIKIISLDPVIFEMDMGKIKVLDNDFELIGN